LQAAYPSGIAYFRISGVHETGDWSQNPEGAGNCRWSIVTNHGSTTLCVSHARWLATGNGFVRIFAGLLILFAAIECLIFAGRLNVDPPPHKAAA
jgi:hypothetical protein